MMMGTIARYWHTLRYLRPVQVYGRLWFRLYRPRPEVRPAPAVRPVEGFWVAPVARPVSLLGPMTFRFLNATHALGPGATAWNDPARDKLWLYNLHYFDDLNAAPSPLPSPGGEEEEERWRWHLALLQRWVAENPPGYGNGWEPYPTSLRIVNWIKWALVPQVLSPACLHSLAVQARWLSRRLEYHLLGNHLFANAKALVFAGAFFVGPEAEGWLALGQRLLRRELAEQILPDGGHFERSPMYHAILLEDVLDLINLAGAYPGTLDPGLVRLCRERVAAMLTWLAVMSHPDGEIGFFNDAAMGIAPQLADLVAYGRRLGVGVGRPSGDDDIQARDSRPGTERAPIWLRDSGYVRLAAGPAVALLDVAPIGPDYLPGHAHADTLSFELSLFGQRVIVNGGTSRYGTGPERLAERGTAAHSTVQLDGANSSEVWGGFRVARRARPFAVQVRRGDPVEDGVAGGTAHHAVQKVTAAHDGYRRLPGRPVHRREWRLTPELFSVADTIEGGYGVAVARFHLHPAIGIEGPAMAIEGPAFASEGLAMTGDGMETSAGGGPSAWGFPPGGHLLLPGGQRVHWQVTGGRVRLVPDHWHPEFGLSVASRCLEVEFADGVCRLDLTWAAEV